MLGTLKSVADPRKHRNSHFLDDRKSMVQELTCKEKWKSDDKGQFRGQMEHCRAFVRTHPEGECAEA